MKIAFKNIKNIMNDFVLFNCCFLKSLSYELWTFTQLDERN